MDMMSRDYIYTDVCYCDQAGQLGESGTLGREGWGEGREYSEVQKW
jgi:hypothetical protein